MRPKKYILPTFRVLNRSDYDDKLEDNFDDFIMCTASLAGCIGSEDKEEEEVGACSGDKLVIAYEVKEDMDADSLQNPQQIADYLCEKLGMDVSIYNVGSSGLAMEALRFGNADIAMNIDGGPAWVGWNAYGLDVMAADTKSDGRA